MLGGDAVFAVVQRLRTRTSANVAHGHTEPLRRIEKSRTTLLALLLFIASVFVPGVSWTQDNILIILADDLGTDKLCRYRDEDFSPVPPPCPAGDVPATPKIDEMIDEGVMFLEAWSNPICSTTRMTVTTGLYSLLTNVRAVVTETDTEGLEDRDWTVPEMLDAAALAGRIPQSYAKGAFGKWHMNHEPTPSDFDEPVRLGGYDYFEGTIAVVSPNYCNYTWITVDGASPPDDVPEFEYVTSKTVDSAVTWLQGVTEPWLMYVAFHAPHDPFHRVSGGTCASNCLQGEEKECFAEMLGELDTQIGELFRRIDEDTPHERPTVIFLGDNGTTRRVIEEDVYPTNHAKNTVFEGGIRVPFVVSGPAVAPSARGRITRDLVNTTDLMATVADLAGVADFKTLAPPAYQPLLDDTFSIVPYLEADPEAACMVQDCREEAFAETEGSAGGNTNALAYRNISDPNCESFKLVRGCLDCSLPQNAEECDLMVFDCPNVDCLFDLSTDRMEQVQLPGTHMCFAPLVAGLEAKLTDLVNKTGEFGHQNGCPVEGPAP